MSPTPVETAACAPPRAKSAHAALKRRVPELVVGRTLLLIFQDVVGPIEFLELGSASGSSGLRSGWNFMASLR